MPKKLNNPKSDQNEGAERGELFLKWRFPEYIKYPRGSYWYIAMGILFIGGIIYSTMVANFLFALFLILLAIIVILHTRRKPIELDFGIFEDGLAVGTRFYEWSDIKNFRIVYRPPNTKRLYIDLKSAFLPDFSIPLEDKNPLQVREILKNYLKEDLTKEEETLTDRLGRWLKI